MAPEAQGLPASQANIIMGQASPVAHLQIKPKILILYTTLIIMFDYIMVMINNTITNAITF